MKKNVYSKIQFFLLTLLGGLMAAVLLYLWMVPNVSIEQSRKNETYRKVENVFVREVENTDAPTGKIREFTFFLKEEVAYDSTLMFKFSHQNAEVYLNAEKVYSLTAAPELSIVRTPGINWAMIPLFREDAEKQVKVVLTPIYEDFQTQQIEFFIGSKMALYQEELKRALPEIILSITDILVGFGMLCAAAYFSIRKELPSSFYALAMLAISLGMWNITQIDFTALMFSRKTVFVYYISLTMLVLCIVPLLKSIKVSKQKLSGRILMIWSLLCSTISCTLLIIQLFGIWDLREMLKIVHGMIVVSSLLLIGSGLEELRKRDETDRREKGQSGVWLLGAGALVDMVLYYKKDSSYGLLFVLISILCFVLYNGIKIFLSYMEQKKMLEEKEVQLTLSRITTMMSQIRSHFVFNILNAISGMCKYDPEKADETVVRFARYLRNNIDIMEDDKPIPFSAELSRLEDYVVLEQVRFGDKIEFYSDVKTDQFLIPPLILQPIVENAIKHGLVKKPSGGTVILYTWEEDANIKIKVEDDGVGFELSELEKEKSVGLKNIRYRLLHLAGGSLEIQSQVGKGTAVTITIPKKR